MAQKDLAVELMKVQKSSGAGSHCKKGKEQDQK